MTHALPHPIRMLLLALLGTMLAACQTMPPPAAGFSPAQVAALQSQGFVEAGTGWELTLNERLLFASDQSALQPEQTARLSEIARRLVSVGIATARIEGHTDSTGTSSYNQRLSQARAQAVAAPLQEGGMRFTAGQIVGRGESIPLSPNNTAEGRQDNRRVVVVVTPQN